MKIFNKVRPADIEGSTGITRVGGGGGRSAGCAGIVIVGSAD
jgi:hypothetical protein